MVHSYFVYNKVKVYFKESEVFSLLFLMSLKFFYFLRRQAGAVYYQIDFNTGVITNVTKGTSFQGQAFPEFMQKIIAAEGLINYINNK